MGVVRVEWKVVIWEMVEGLSEEDGGGGFKRKKKVVVCLGGDDGEISGERKN